MKVFLFLLLFFSLFCAEFSFSVFLYVGDDKKVEDKGKFTEKDAYYGDNWSKMDEDFEKSLNGEDADEGDGKTPPPLSNNNSKEE